MTTNNSINKTSDTFVATTSVTTPTVSASNIITASGNLNLTPNGASNIVANAPLDIGGFGSSYIKSIGSTIQFTSTASGTSGVDLINFGGSNHANSFRFSGNGSVSNATQIYEKSAGVVGISGLTQGSSANIDLNGGTGIAANFTATTSITTPIVNTSSSDLTFSPSTGLTNANGTLRSTNSGAGQNLFEGLVSGDSVPRASFYTGVNLTGISLGRGNGNNSYLTYTGINGTLTVCSSSNGTGSGILDTNSGTVKAGSFANGSANLSLDSGTLAATLTANSLTIANGASGNLTLGNTTNTASSSPLHIDMGGTNSSTPGSNLKLMLWNGGSTQIGFGISSGQLDYAVPTGNSHAWWISTTKQMFLDSSGVLNLNVGLKLPTSGGTAATLDFFESGTLTTNWTGVWSAAQAGNIQYQRIGKNVTLRIPLRSATANTGTIITNTVALPSELRPAGFCANTCQVVDNNIAKVGLVTVNSGTGIIQITADVGGGNFSGTGTTGLSNDITLSYLSS